MAPLALTWPPGVSSWIIPFHRKPTIVPAKCFSKICGVL